MTNHRIACVKYNAKLVGCAKQRIASGADRRVTGKASAILAVLFLGLMTPSGGSAQTGPPSPEIVKQGQGQFKQSCGFCHGADATGARGPDLVRSKVVAHDVNGDLIGEVIRNGRPDKGMPALQLSAENIRAVAAFLHDRAHEALESAQVPEKYPLEKLLTGNAQAGQAFFNSAGGCKSCHSPTGDLKGIARKYEPIRLQERMLYPEGGTSKSTVTVTLPSGERLQGPLVHLDEFTVALRDGSGWYKSFARDNVRGVEVHDPLAAHRKLLDELTQEQFHNLFAYLETLR
jgi:cytochrome c oxidase cbb3-type subunit 3